MTRKEIKRKFDEIVDFSGVEMYIDTPVKRYSSGMYVRLAFGVAAHLEPEILIIDEVLAVGDAEFQKKCLGKMSDVASDGRTIIFVSHNLLAVQSLCKSAIFMKSGTIADSGPTDKVINNYLSREIKNSVEQVWELADAPGNENITVLSARITSVKNEQGTGTIDVNSSFDMEFEFINHVAGNSVNLSLILYTTSGVCVFNVSTPVMKLEARKYKSVLHIPGSLLNDDIYTIVVHFVKDVSSFLFSMEDLLTFEVQDVRRGDTGWYGKWPGAVRPTLLEFTLD
jgi:lipopolysaccharide transport system ATP-binding protein